jgi:hypothetical protein
MGKWSYGSTVLELHWMEVSGQLHTPATLPLGTVPQHPLARRPGGPRGVEKRKILCLFRELNVGRPAHNLVAIQTELIFGFSAKY